MIARVIVAKREMWYENVGRISADGRYLTLELDAYPHKVHYYLPRPVGASVLLCVDDAEVTAALQEERG